MSDWLGWLADLLLNAGARVASIFVSSDAPGFTLFEMAMALLILVAVVSVVVYWESLVEFWRSRSKPGG